MYPSDFDLILLNERKICGKCGRCRKDKRGWKDYNSHEKLLYYILGGVFLLTILFVIVSIIVGMKLNDPEEVIYPTKPATTTLLPPWLTTTSTLPTTTTTTTTTEHPATNTCLDTECVLAASQMMAKMSSEKVNPCEDFYKYACGGFLEDPIPDTQSLWDQFTITEELWAKDFQKILETEIDEEEPEPITQAKQLYASCMNLGNSDYTELKTEVDALLLPAGTELAEVLANLRKNLGANYLFKTYVDLDEIYTEGPRQIYIDQPEFGLSRPFLSDPAHNSYAAYKTLVEEVFNAIYTSGGTEAAEAVLKIETGLDKISTIPEERRNRTALYNPMTVQELYELSEMEPDKSAIKWDVFFENLLGEIDLEMDLEELTVIVRDVDYFTSVNSFLESVNPDELRIFLQWRTIQEIATASSLELQELFFKFQQATEGLYTAPRRWRICADQTSSLMGHAVGYAYLQENPIEETKSKVDYMIFIIKDAFVYLLNYREDLYTWMTPETKLQILEKLSTLTAQIAYPDFFENPKENDTIESYYEDLKFRNPENLMLNVLDILKWEGISSLQAIQASKDITRWTHDPLVVNAFYSPTNNAITIPAGVLRKPWFNVDMTVEYLNMATLGTIIGHEIIHGLDDLGRQYDPSGNLTEWWDEDSLSQFTELTQCFVDQYSQYEVPDLGMKLNGRNTVAENIADNGGFNLARMAYTLNYGAEKILPGFDANGFTDGQLYYLAYAQSFCGSYTKEEMERTVKVDTHVPDPFRVRGVLENNEEFKSVWSCETSRSQDTCQIW
ncbi:unnamed protein product [Allacma fusca]|uniref:Endothelin-converting enzyme 1 n=1 Tax=Allacma fusca TaxID=39272 RepID=A0A8J2L152_9HEXA|nr:unnamed protein product [Allacma fusca]